MASKLKINNIEDALEIYYSYQELGTAEIARLFGCGRSAALKLKKIALEEQARQEKLTFSDSCVNTKCAYDAWHIDVADMERRVMKLRKLRLKPDPVVA